MKKIWPFLFVLCLFSSCEKDEGTSDGTADCKIQTMSFTVPGDSQGYDIEFTYDGSERLVKVVKTEYDIGDPYVVTYDIEYGSGNLVNRITSTSSFGYGNVYNFFGADGRIDSVSTHGVPHAETWTLRQMKFHYDGDKITEMVSYRYDAQSGNYIPSTTSFIWEGENLIQAGNQTFTYDDHPSALRHVGLAFAEYESYAILSKNNLTSYNYGGGERTFSYTYNDNGYPATMNNGFNDGTVVFDYNCK